MISYKLLTKKYDKEICKLFDNNPIGKGTELIISYPSYFDFVNNISISDKSIGAFDKDKLVAIGSMLVQERYLAGKKKKIGYMTCLRTIPDYQKRGILSNSMTKVKEYLNEVDIGMASFVSDNKDVIKIFSSGKKGYPKFHHTADLITYIAKIPKSKPVLEIKKEKVNKEIKLFAEELKKKDFTPTSLPKNLFIARKNGRIVAIFDIWNQENFRKIIIKKYSIKMKLFTKYLRYVHKFNLPKEGGSLQMNYLSYMAVKDNNPRILKDVLFSLNPGLYSIGFDARDPLNQGLSSVKSVKYESKFFTINEKYTSRLINPEIAMF